MYATVQRWGNSQGVRIPKISLDESGIKENDRVEIIPAKNEITIRKTASSGHKTTEERLIAFYKKPVEEIDRSDCPVKFDWGAPKGAEAW